jgi:orotate phosphoribosyltransferase
VTPQAVAKLLVEVGAVEVRPDPDDWFTWSSGVRAPVYCDNRRVISFPAARARIADALADATLEHFAKAEVIAGTATAGISWAAWVAERCDLPMVYVRGEAKGHGRQRRVEGRPLSGEHVVIIEDLLSYGGSALSAVCAVQEEGGEVIGVQSIVSWSFPEAERAFAEAGIPWRSLTDYAALIGTLELTPDQARVLLEWRGH